MRGEATSIAATLERSGRLVLHQLQNIPEAALNWMIRIPACHSLFEFADCLLKTNELWV